MNSTIKIKAGVVLAHISMWCGMLPYLTIVVFLILNSIKSTFCHFIDFNIKYCFWGSILIFLLCPIMAVILGHSSQIFFSIAGLSHAGARKKIKTGLISGYFSLIILCALAVLPIFDSPQLRPDNNLKQLHIMLSLYEQKYGSLPKVTPEGGNGVHDLYPLYSTGIMSDDALELLQPHGTALRPFCDRSTNDFNRYTIGLSYNSTAKLNDPDNPPLMADQGVSSGSLQLSQEDRGIKPREENGALVLFADGSIEFINTVNKRGKLSTSRVSLEKWALLKD